MSKPTKAKTWTHVNLACMDDLLSTPSPDAWGRLRKPFSPTLARIGAEFSSASYKLSVAPFLSAGWKDVNFLLENDAFSLEEALTDKQWQQELSNEWRLLRAQYWIQTANPVGDVIRAKKQLTTTDTGKTVLMARPLDDGRAVIAIAFIGTTQRLYDWFSNFKLHVSEGMHRGFLELARHFLRHAEQFNFPETARLLGRERLTLAEALEEATRPDSRISFFLTGHSQGGATVQTTLRLLRAQGVLDEHLSAYTFAAPKVAALGAVGEPADYPIYNIINADDFVPLLGGQLRLGMDMIYEPDDAFRSLCYNWPDAPADAAIQAARSLLARARSSEDVMAYMIALLRGLETMPDHGRAMAILRRLIDRYPFFGQVSQFAEGYLERGLTRFLRWLEGAYHEISGQALSEAQALSMQRVWQEFYEAAGGFERAMEGLRSAMAAPHPIQIRRHIPVPPYLLIARSCLPTLSDGIWQPDAPPRCTDPQGVLLLGTAKA